MKRQGYRFEAQTIDPRGKPLQSNCADVAFVNYGTNTLIVNDVIRVPPPAVVGQFTIYSLGGNLGEIDRSFYKTKFEGAGSSKAIFIRRIYTED